MRHRADLITLVVLPIAAVAFARSGPLWRSIGSGPFAIDQDLPPRAGGRPAPPVDPAIQAAEARQMLEARSYRLRAARRGAARRGGRGRGQLLEAAAGQAGAVDEELREEVRRLVIAQNERRLRRGEAQLNVEDETDRQLADFIRSG